MRSRSASDEAQEAARFIQQFGNQLAKLEPMVSVLQSDPEQFEQLKEDYAASQQVQRDARQQAFVLAEVVQRRAHFSYSDAAEMFNGNNDLNEKLRQRLWSRRKRNVPKPVKRCVAMRRSTVSTIRCWLR